MNNQDIIHFHTIEYSAVIRFVNYLYFKYKLVNNIMDFIDKSKGLYYFTVKINGKKP